MYVMQLVLKNVPHCSFFNRSCRAEILMQNLKICEIAGIRKDSEFIQGTKKCYKEQEHESSLFLKIEGDHEAF